MSIDAHLEMFQPEEDLACQKSQALDQNSKTLGITNYYWSIYKLKTRESSRSAEASSTVLLISNVASHQPFRRRFPRFPPPTRIHTA